MQSWGHHWGLLVYDLSISSQIPYPNEGRGQLIISTPTHLIIKVAVDSHFRLGLPFKESVMEFLIINRQFPEFRSNSLPRSLLQTFSIFFVLQSRSHLHDTSGLEERREREREKYLHYSFRLYFDELRETKRWFLYSSLPLEVLPLKAPVTRYLYCITSRLTTPTEIIINNKRELLPSSIWGGVGRGRRHRAFQQGPVVPPAAWVGQHSFYSIDGVSF